jgi:putative cell wall-binding protein
VKASSKSRKYLWLLAGFGVPVILLILVLTSMIVQRRAPQSSATHLAPTLFATKADYPTGGTGGVGTKGVAAADFNNDLVLDLAVGNNPDDTVGILLGNGDGTFAAATTLATPSTVGGFGARGIAAADFDTNGSVDLAVTLLSEATGVAIFLGNGDGTFGSPTTEPVGVTTSQGTITAADLNGDTNPDLAVASLVSTVTVLIGNGTGGFAAPVDYAIGSSVHDVEAVDINNDTYLDLVGGRGTGIGVNVYRLFNNGDGTFGAVSNFTAGSSGVTHGIALPDINGDGNSDLATARINVITHTAILLGDGTGAFGSSTSPTLAGTSNDVVAGDYNQDCKVDFFYTHNTLDTTSVIVGEGEGGFGSLTNYPTGAGPRALVAGDFNADGVSDVAVSNESADTVSVFLNISLAKLSVSPETFAVSEGSSATYQVVLTQEPHADVNISIAGNSQVTVNPSTVTFTTSNYATPQTVTLTAVEDQTAESTTSVTLTHTVTSTDLEFDAICPVTATASVSDAASVPPPAPPEDSSVERISAAGPTLQSIEVSQALFPGTENAPRGVIARNDVFADVMTVSPLVSLTGGTLLLNDPNALSSEVLTELNRAVGPGKPVYLAGGIEAQSQAVEDALVDAGYLVTRLGRENRRSTAVAIAEEITVQNATATTSVFVADDSFFADSLATGGVAGRLDRNGNVKPILLNLRGADTIDPALQTFLDQRSSLVELELVGGPSALGPGLESVRSARYPNLVTLVRTAGANRFATNVALLQKHVVSPAHVVVANGEASALPGAPTGLSAQSVLPSGFFNALLAGPYATEQNAALLLTRTNELPPEAESYLASIAQSLTTITILGDISQVSLAVEEDLRALIQ